MKPLQAVGLGFVFLVLVTTVRGYDLYADWFGWGLVLVGVRKLPGDFPLRWLLLYLAALALGLPIPNATRARNRASSRSGMVFRTFWNRLSSKGFGEGVMVLTGVRVWHQEQCPQSCTPITLPSTASTSSSSSRAFWTTSKCNF